MKGTSPLALFLVISFIHRGLSVPFPKHSDDRLDKSSEESDERLEMSSEEIDDLLRDRFQKVFRKSTPRIVSSMTTTSPLPTSSVSTPSTEDDYDDENEHQPTATPSLGDGLPRPSPNVTYVIDSRVNVITGRAAASGERTTTCNHAANPIQPTSTVYGVYTSTTYHHVKREVVESVYNDTVTQTAYVTSTSSVPTSPAPTAGYDSDVTVTSSPSNPTNATTANPLLNHIWTEVTKDKTALHGLMNMIRKFVKYTVGVMLTPFALAAQKMASY